MPRANQQHSPAPRKSFLKARATAAEVAAVEKAAMRLGLRPSTFVRAVVLDASTSADGFALSVSATPSPAPDLDAASRKTMDATRAEIIRVHNNANQLVRLCHRGVVKEAALTLAVEELASQCRRLISLLGGVAK